MGEKYCQCLAPDQPPAASFLWHPKIQMAACWSDFWHWKDNTMVKFYHFGSEQDMLSEQKILQKYSAFLSFSFQYIQIPNFVNSFTKSQ